MKEGLIFFIMHWYERHCVLGKFPYRGDLKGDVF